MAWDLAFASFLAIVALSLQSARDGGLPVMAHLSGDAANIASFAAGADHRERFLGDPLLELASTTAYYAVAHVPLVRLLARATGDYGRAFTAMLAIHVLLQGLGFYVLGLLVLRSRPWAALFALATLVPVALNLGTFWGAIPDALPRVSYQALWPWGLALCVKYAHVPRRWPLILAGLGALAWIHPPSAPAAGFAAWCGLLAVRPAGLSKRSWLVALVGAGLAFLALALPLYATVLASRIDPGASLEPAAVRAALEHRFSHGLLGVPHLLAEFLSILARTGVLWLGLAGAAALFFVRPEAREHARRLGLWALGLVLIGAGIPLLDWAHARATDGFPGQVDLVRAVRYLVPLALLAAALGARELAERVRPRWRAVTLLIGAVALGQHVYRFTPSGIVTPALRCWAGGQFACGEDPLPDWTETLVWLRDHGPEGSILTVDVPEPMAVRFVSLRPLAWCFKDGSTFGYVDRPRLLEWHQQSLIMGRVLAEPAGERRWSAAAAFAESLPSRPAAILSLGPAPVPPPLGWRVSHVTGRWIVLERDSTDQSAD